MTFLFTTTELFIWGLSYALPDVSWDVDQAQAAGLLAGSAAILAQTGYRRCLTLGPTQTFLDLTTAAARSALTAAGSSPRALLFQHANYESATAPWDASAPDADSRYSYFAPVLMRNVGLDHVPYFSLFESACAGFALLLSVAGSQFLSTSGEESNVCILGDRRPDNAPFDLANERILWSEHASSFVIGKQPAGYQVLGVKCYSTARTGLPFLELVKRTVQMIKELAENVNVDLASSRWLVHYPNIFPDAWKMTSRSLRLREDQPVMIDMPERAHCGASDSVISLAKLHRGDEGRVHVVVTYGAGAHLAVSILKEKANISVATAG